MQPCVDAKHAVATQPSRLLPICCLCLIDTRNHTVTPVVWSINITPFLPASLPVLLCPGLPACAQLRKLFAPGFTAGEIERYLPRVQAIAQRFCASWAAAGALPQWQEEVKLFTFEVIVNVVAGIDWE